MSNCRTISRTFYSPIYPVDERNEDVGLVEIHLIVFLFGMNQVHCSSLNSRVQGEYLNCIVSAKIAKLWGEYLTIQLYGQQPDCW